LSLNILFRLFLSNLGCCYFNCFFYYIFQSISSLFYFIIFLY
jgi:hypothetical protein